ncbi:MAG: 1-deoxy-D-xylulose-5-phosphate reductoisomerase [Bacilli bacterium]|nr:1-deoxy-D-xylulose-5-phosphate reductoisomerase [Bacilli bacterium]
MKKVLLLGASGSIGTQSLDILEKHPTDFTLVGFSVGHRVEKIPEILARFPDVNLICVQEQNDFEALKAKYPSRRFFFGDEGLIELMEAAQADMVVNALVGFAGLLPSLTALRGDKILCLANKESLVVGGSLIQSLLRSGHGKLYPIDSEHVAIAKLLSSVPRENIRKVLITASGGAFRDKTRQELETVTPEDALAHPTWKMGKKITIDCATMMNKGFEVIEAAVLFGLPLEQVEIILHRESIIHSMLEMSDGTYLADVSSPDMHGPIEYALMEGNVPFAPAKAESLSDYRGLHFQEFKPERYLAPGIALRAYAMGGTALATLNAANEEAVYAFLEGKLSFLGIDAMVEKALDTMPYSVHASYRDLKKADADARAFVRRRIGG